MNADLVGTLLLGKLRVVRRLGAGGLGVVYEVEHTVTGHRRALKLLKSELSLSGEAATRFVREAKVASLVRSPFLVDTLDAGRLPDGTAYVLMELAEGRSLRAVLEDEGRLEPTRACRVALDVCAGLEAVHGAGFVHRDVKPENLQLTPHGGDDGGERAMLLDFGVCRALEPTGVFETITREGAAPGTPAYLSPERFDASRGLSPAADLWSLGVVLFEMLGGRRPFQGATAAAVIAAIRRDRAPELRAVAPDVPEALADLVDRALSREPHDRFASAAELARALRGIVGRSPAEPRASAAVIGDRYAIVRPLGRGGAGAVFEVRDLETGARRALKLLHLGGADARAVSRLRREAELGARLERRAGLVHVHELGEDPRAGVYLVMELLEGEGLDALLAREGGLAPAPCLALLSELATSLDALHEAGIVHRDVKPANLFLERTSGGAPRLRLLDLGVAKVLGQATLDATADGAMIGTPAYAAPEQLERNAEVGPAADRYSAAHVAFAMLVGRPYFDGEAKAGMLPLLAAIGGGTTEPASQRAKRLGARLPPELDGWFARATSRDAAARFPSSSAMHEALAELLSSRSTDTDLAVSTSRGPGGRPARSGRSLALGVAASAGVVAALAIGLSAASGPARPESSAALVRESPAPPLAPVGSTSTEAPASPALRVLGGVRAAPGVASGAGGPRASTEMLPGPTAGVGPRAPTPGSSVRAGLPRAPPAGAEASARAAAAAASAGVPAETFF